MPDDEQSAAEASVTAAARALIAARNNAVERCKSKRPSQNNAEGDVNKAKRTLKEAEQRYEQVSNEIGAALDEVTELGAAYKKLTGYDIPRPYDDHY